MKKKVFINSHMFAVSASIVCLVLSGCGKSAETIKDYGSGDTVAEASVETQKDLEGKPDDKNIQEENWKETLNGDGKLFNDITISASLKNDGSDRHVITVQADEYNKDYAKKLCDSVFGGVSEVYDYSAKTKKIYDADIQLYEDIKTMYQDPEASMLHDGLFPDELYEEIGIDENQMGAEEFSKELGNIDKKIEELRQEKEKAPESVDNDYSYGGYIGNILGNEYYMYFGNRNYDEYISSPFQEGNEYDGRVVTICRSDLKSMFDGKAGYISDYVSQEFDWVTPYGSEEMQKKGEEFVESIGYGDYKYDGAGPRAGAYVEGVINGAMEVRGLPEAYLPENRSDSVAIYRFTLGGERDNYVGLFDVRYIECDESKDMMNSNSYIDVYVTDAGVLGCKMVNPMDVKKIEVAESIISPKDVKDIITENIDNRDAWNIPVNDERKSLMLTKWRLINFPIKSKEDKNEYTYVPAYILYHEINPDEHMITNADQLRNEPFILINALDGSIIKVQKELTVYPEGYKRGNEGYTALIAGRWKRDEGMNFGSSFFDFEYDDKMAEEINIKYKELLNSATDAKGKKDD